MKISTTILLLLCLPVFLIAQVQIVESGDVGVKNETPEHELDIEGVTRTSNYFEGVYTNKSESWEFNRILFPEDASLYVHSSSTGAIKVSLPKDWSNNMLKFTVEIYSFKNNKSFSVDIAGYPYTGSGGIWYNTATSASINGGGPYPQIPVRFAHDGVKPCVIIGEIDTQWTYLNVTISDLYVRTSTGNTMEDWTKDWDISLINNLPSNIDKTQYISSAYHTISDFKGGGKETSKFYLSLNNHPAGADWTLGKLHLPGVVTSFDVTVSGALGSVTYQFVAYASFVSKNIINISSRHTLFPIDEIMDVEVEYNPAGVNSEVIIQIRNLSPTLDNGGENIIVESHSGLASPYFTLLDYNAPFTASTYQLDQNSARGKWENANGQSVQDLDQTISRNGDVYINDIAKGLIVKDQADGNCYRLITTNGVVSSTLVACPQ